VGLARKGARLLLEEARQRPFYGRLLQMGRQNLYFGQSDMDQLASLHAFKLHRDVPSQNIHQPLVAPECLDDATFFSQLGFSEVESIDYSSDENATYAHDLNKPVPDILKQRYDVIYDGGTMEHIFDVRSVLHNIFDMLRVGGRIIHSHPSSNHVDHGFYMFSPTFFLDYYATNEFLIHELQIITYSKAHDTEPWSIYDYEPDCLSHLEAGGFGSKMLGIQVAAEKTPHSTWDRIPQQGRYVRSWKDHHHGASQPVIARKTKKPPWLPQATVPPRRNLIDVLLRRPAPTPAPPDPIPNKVAEY